VGLAIPLFDFYQFDCGLHGWIITPEKPDTLEKKAFAFCKSSPEPWIFGLFQVFQLLY